MPEAPPAPTQEVSMPAPTPGPKPVEAAPPSSKYSSVREALKANAGPTPEEPPPKPTPDKPPVTPPKPADKKPELAAPEKPAEPPASEKPNGKFNPVKELKVAKSRITELETENNRLKTSIVPEQERTTLTQRMESIQAENEKLKNQIRFKDYENSPEFTTKFQQPYIAAIDEATKFLGRIPVTDQSGQQRAATVQDLFELMAVDANDPAKAIDLAEERFGKLSSRVLERMEKVRDVLNARNNALEEEKKNGANREQTERENSDRQTKAVAKHVLGLWQKAHEAFVNDPKDPEMKDFIFPITIPEGKQATPEEQEHNDALERGFRLVDEWWGKKVPQCKNAEELSEMVRHQAAIRARAAGFGPLRKIARRLKSENAKLKAELAQYQETVPDAGGRLPRGGAPAKGNGVPGGKGKWRDVLRPYAGRGTT